MCTAQEIGSRIRWHADHVLLCRMGIQQREVPGLDISPFLTPDIFISCLPGMVDMAQDGAMGE